MVTSVAARSQVVDSPAVERALRLVPGLALLFAIGYAGKYVESWIRAYVTSRHLSLPNIEYVLWAILFGLILGNALAGFRWFKLFAPGIATYEFFLKLGIALFGVRFLLADVVKLGGISLVLVALEFALATAMMLPGSRGAGLGWNNRVSTPSGITLTLPGATLKSRMMSAREDSEPVMTAPTRRATLDCIRTKEYQRRLVSLDHPLAWASSILRSTLIG